MRFRRNQRKRTCRKAPARIIQLDLARLKKGDHTHQRKTPLTKSLLRYPGGKSRIARFVAELLEDYTGPICSPFLRAGWMELALASRGNEVRGYDAWRPLVDFWRCSVWNAKRVAAIAKQYYPLSRDEFHQLKKDFFRTRRLYERVAIFFVLNCCAYSGCTFTGFSEEHKTFTRSLIERLENFRIENFSVEFMDFRDSIPSNRDALLLLDPPYMHRRAGYGYKGELQQDFDHEGLFELLRERDDWLLWYDDCREVRDWYSRCDIVIPQWRYTMSKDKRSDDILIVNSDVNESAIRRLAA